jgi:hypothetical protein
MRKAAAVSVCVLGLIVAAPASADNSLVGSWHFNEGVGTAVADASGYGNNGTLSGATQWTGGVWGTALAFDGSAGHGGNVQVPNGAPLEPTAGSGISVTAWVKAPGSPGAFKYIVAKGASGCIAASYALYTGAGGGLMFYVSNNGGVSYTLSPDASPGIWDGKWHFVAGTYDGSAVHLYVDGSEVGSGAPFSGPIGYGLTDTNDLVIAHYAGCSGLDFSGTVDEPQVWMRALSASDVRGVMDPFTGFFQPVDNLPTVNTLKAGSAVPVKFTLGTNLGLGILAAGSPGVHAVSCSTGEPTDAIEQTVTAGASSLQYDPSSNQYTYVWKTDKTWAGTCRQFDVMLNNGSTHSAMFKFTK